MIVEHFNKNGLLIHIMIITNKFLNLLFIKDLYIN